jgi:hypothetical protein
MTLFHVQIVRKFVANRRHQRYFGKGLMVTVGTIKTEISASESGQVRLGQARLGQVRPGQIGSGWVRSDRVWLGQV